MSEFPKLKEIDDRVWEGFQRIRKMFLGMSVALALYSWGNVTVEKFSFLGASFIIRDPWTFQSPIILIWAALGWRYWIYEREVREVEVVFNERNDNAKGLIVDQEWHQKLIREMTSRLSRELEKRVRPEIDTMKRSEDPNGQSEFSGGAQERESFAVLKTNPIKSRIRGRKWVNGRTHVCYEKNVDLSISGYENIRAYLKALVSLAATFRPFSDFKGPYIVAGLTLLGLIRNMLREVSLWQNHHV